MNNFENTKLIELEPEFDQALAEHLNTICSDQIRRSNPICLLSPGELEFVTAQGLSIHRRRVKDQLKTIRFSSS